MSIASWLIGLGILSPQEVSLTTLPTYQRVTTSQLGAHSVIACPRCRRATPPGPRKQSHPVGQKAETLIRGEK